MADSTTLGPDSPRPPTRSGTERRDDGRMATTAPPDPHGASPLPPPSGRPVGDDESEPPSERRPITIGSWEAPFTSVQEAAEWWFKPLLDPATWINLCYLFVGVFTAVFGFIVVVTLLSISLPLIIIGIGIPLTVLSFSAVNGMAGIERRRAEWVGDPIPPRPLAPRADGWWQRLITRFTDPTRWRQVAYFLVSFFALPTLFAIGALPLWIALQSIFGAGFAFSNDFSGIPIGNLFGGFFAVGNILVAIVAAGLISRASTLVGRVTYGYVAWFLGPDRTAELEARVDTLSGQRAEILEAVAAERRRIERNLHDGVQQQLVAIGIDIGRAAARIDTDPGEAKKLLDDARDKVRGSVGELRMIGRGLHPAVLEDRGLDAALSSIVARAPIPVDIRIDAESIPADVAETAYYVANEAIANTLKHSGARVASIRVTELDRLTPARKALQLVVHDDGNGGADGRRAGTGLAGMAARVQALDGTLTVDSPAGGPTVVTAVIPYNRQGAA
jgi:signal transduction histidine kinase